MTDLRPKVPTPDLPKPEKRKPPTPRQIAEIFIRQEARCATCKAKLTIDNYQIDHVQALAFLGSNQTDNLQAICADPCHKAKTKRDNFEAKKGARIRGETCNGPTRPIQSRGFDKTKSRRFNGTVTERAR